MGKSHPKCTEIEPGTKITPKALKSPRFRVKVTALATLGTIEMALGGIERPLRDRQQELKWKPEVKGQSFANGPSRRRWAWPERGRGPEGGTRWRRGGRGAAMTSKAKKRVVLPTRPEPPNTDQIIEDVQRAQPNDPVFVLLAEPSEDLPTPAKNEDPEAKRERLYRLTQSYVEMNHRLQKACSLLKEKCEELKLAGATLEQGILEMKQRAL